MNAVPALPAAARFRPLTAPTHHGSADETWRGETWNEDHDRLPPGIAYAIILLLSAGGWALIVTLGLWLYRVLG